MNAKHLARVFRIEKSESSYVRVWMKYEQKSVRQTVDMLVNRDDQPKIGDRIAIIASGPVPVSQSLNDYVSNEL